MRSSIQHACRLMIPAVCCLTVLMLGCSGGSHEPTAPVHGTVTLDGKPLPYGQVVFQPLSGRIAKGVIKDGRYTLSTFETADGAVLGHHCISVTARKKLDTDEPGAPGIPQFSPSLIPDHYGNSSESGLEYDVVIGDNVYNIELSSRR